MTPSTLPSSETLNSRPGYVDSPTNITWLDPGGMQIELGAPIIPARRAPVGVSPLTGGMPGGGGTSIVNIRRKLPSVSKIELPRSRAASAPGFHPIAILVVFRDTRIDVAIGDVDVPFGIPRHIGRLAEKAVHRGHGRIDVLPCFAVLVG